LVKRWRKSYDTFLRKKKKRQRKEKLAKAQTILQKTLREHAPTATIGELRAMVGQTLGITLELRQGSVQAHCPTANETPSPPPL